MHEKVYSLAAVICSLKFYDNLMTSVGQLVSQPGGRLRSPHSLCVSEVNMSEDTPPMN